MKLFRAILATAACAALGGRPRLFQQWQDVRRVVALGNLFPATPQISEIVKVCHVSRAVLTRCTLHRRTERMFICFPKGRNRGVIGFDWGQVVSVLARL